MPNRLRAAFNPARLGGYLNSDDPSNDDLVNDNLYIS
jgi:hypothetical protein